MALRGELTVVDQVSDGTTVEVASAAVYGTPGFLVVHREDKGGPGPVMGHAPLQEGGSAKVLMPMDQTLESGAYWVMLHRDAGAVGTYEWPGPDGPIRASVGLSYVEKRVILTVQ